MRFRTYRKHFLRVAGIYVPTCMYVLCIYLFYLHDKRSNELGVSRSRDLQYIITIPINTTQTKRTSVFYRLDACHVRKLEAVTRDVKKKYSAIVSCVYFVTIEYLFFVILHKWWFWTLAPHVPERRTLTLSTVRRHSGQRTVRFSKIGGLALFELITF